MARSSIPVLTVKKYAALSSKNKNAHQAVHFEGGMPRKIPMSAYYPPQQRGFINIDQWDMDDSETDEIFHA